MPAASQQQSSVVEEDAGGMNKMTQCAPNGDWSQTSTLFVQGNQGGTKEGGPSRDSSFTSRRVASVSLLGTAIPSSEEARRTAPLKSPSSSLAETLPAKVSTGSRMNLPVRLLGADWTMVGFVSSLISCLVCEVKFLRWPPLSGTLIVIVIVIDIHHLFLIFLMSIIYIYVRVASRNRTLAHIRCFEKMADEVGATENRLCWFT